MTAAKASIRRLALGVRVSAFALASLAGPALAGSAAPAEVNAVEGLPFSGTVATYTSTVTTNQRFIDQAYLDLLRRSVDPAALTAFADFLEKGGTRTQVAHALLASDEYRATLVRSVYLTFLRRPADPAGLAAGVSFLDGGASDEQLKADVIGSGEYWATQGGGTLDGFLSALYRDVLGRPIDPAAEVAFSHALAAGATRVNVALDVLTSVEARQDLIGSLYEQLLHRPVDAAGLQMFSALLASGGTDEDVMAAIVGSDEYFGNVPGSFASAAIDWGDGSPITVVSVPVGTVAASHIYLEDGYYPLTVVVDDVDGTSSIAETVTVADAPLSVAPTTLKVVKKTAFTATVATFTDANPQASASDFTASLDWGDGTVSAGTVSALAGGGFAVGGSHQYEAKGSYPISVHVSDGGSSAADAVGSADVGRKTKRK